MASGKVDRYAFLRMQAPPSYVAGLGRGASGFTTRSDIGPAREGPSAETIAAAKEARGEEGDDDDEQFQDPENETGLFAKGDFDEDDDEADRIFGQVDAVMDERRRARREAKEKAEAAEYLKNNPKIQEQYADLKRGLSIVTDTEWENIPEVANLTKRKRAKFDKSYVVPDSVLLTSQAKNSVENSLSAQQMQGGEETPMNGAMTDFREIGEAQNKVLALSIDKVKDSVSGSTTVDPKGYLTDLNSVIHKTEAEIGDIKRGRQLLQSLNKTQPNHAPGWIAAARLEEAAGRMVAARKIIAEGCQKCPRSDEVWREAARLNTPENAKVILAQAVQHIPQSVNIWLEAADLENDVNSKKRVLRKALEYIPSSVKLWRKAVSLESEAENARLLLARAVEVVPTSVELWLALARVETPLKARQVLNNARKAIPTSHEMWIAAARLIEQELEESNGAVQDSSPIDKMMATAVAQLRRVGVELPREEWLKEAERCETNGSIMTSRAIVNATIGIDVDEEQRLETWLDDAASAAANDHIQMARAIYAYALTQYPEKRTLWMKAAETEKMYGTTESYLALVQRAYTALPRVEVFWLMAAKELWRGERHDAVAARAVLLQAFQINPDNEQIWLAACKLEAEDHKIDNARELLNRAMQATSSERIWIKAAAFERIHGSAERALETAREGLKRYATCDKLYMIIGQIHQANGDKVAAREAFAQGVKRCPHSIPLWLLAARLEESDNQIIRTRALIERARYNNAKVPELWLEGVRLEERQGYVAQAKAILAKGLQECPNSGLLWAESIWMEPRPQRMSKALDALKKTDSDARIIIVVARVFWADRKLDKARTWFTRAIATDPDLGDSFGWWRKFELQHGNAEQQAVVVTRCVAADPHHGPVWQAIAKDPKNNDLNIPAILDLVVAVLS